MYKNPEDHMEAILERFCKDFRPKYSGGQREHEGRLWNKNVRPMAKDEVLDFVSYLYTLDEQIELTIKLLEKNDVQSAINMLKYGNIAGIQERDK